MPRVTKRTFLALFLFPALAFFAACGGDDDTSTARNGDATPTATATATGTPDFTPRGTIELTSPTGGDARAQMTIFTSGDQGVAFTIQGTDVPRSRSGEAYAVWLTGGGGPHRLGFAPVVGADGPISRFLAGVHFQWRGAAVVARGYRQHRTGVFRVPILFGDWFYVASGRGRVQEMASAPDDVLSFNEAIAEARRECFKFLSVRN